MVIDWPLRFQPEKCCVVHLGHNNTGQTYTMKETQENEEDVRKQLTQSEAEKDLGVIIDDKPSFKSHVEGSNSAGGRASDSSFQPVQAELGSNHRLA